MANKKTYENRGLGFDDETDRWFAERPWIESTVCRCPNCSLYYRPTLGHKCKNEVNMIETNLYDKAERYENCTVEVLTNTVTGETSIGWWRADEPPAVIGGKENDGQ